MNGIQFVVSEQGDKTAVMMDLIKYKNVWEDFYDVLIAKSRVKEPRENLLTVKNRLIKQGKINAKI